MTTVLVLAMIRSLLVAGLLAVLAPSIQSALLRHRWLWLPLVAPMLVPSLVIGYAYAESCSVGVVGELGYSALLALRLLPVAVLVQVLLPPPALGEAARHCAWLLPRRPRGTRVHAMRNGWVVGGLVFVLVFQEFELASLCNRDSWTVWLFDAQTGGLPLSETLALASLPVLIEAVILGAVLAVFLRTRRHHSPQGRPTGGPTAFAWPLLAALVVVVVPLFALSPGVLDLGAQLHLTTELGNSLLLSVAAVTCAMILLLSCSTTVLAVLCVPGLLGGLVLGLTLQSLFQLPVLAGLYDTPAPLILGWTLLLLPLGLVVRLAGQRLVPNAALHMANLLAASTAAGHRHSARKLEFALIGLTRAMVPALLFLWAFFEVVLSDLIAPSNMTPVAPRLYNLMHYGQSAGLSAMVLWMGGAAALVGGLAVVGCRLYSRVRVHAI